MNISPEQWETCLNVLQQIAEDPAAIAEQERIKALIAKIHREGKKGKRQASQRLMKAQDRLQKATTAIVQAQQNQRAMASPPAQSNPSPAQLNKPILCYVCKLPFTELDSFYHLLCPTCAVQNYARRYQRADLTGRTALLTGGRLKIGYQTALRLLRDGANVIVTTRFPCDATRRFAGEADFSEWRERIRIYGLDLRNVSAVEAFARELLSTEPALDILIHNAAQTIKRPPEFYEPQLLLERQQGNLSHAEQALLIKPETLCAETPDAFLENPARSISLLSPLFQDGLDADGQPLDLRSANSWSLSLPEVSAIEMLEVQLINVVAPFLLTGQVKPLMLRSPFPRRFIVNVSAMEGQFSRENKTAYHPHTNMAKAALNMMTRTSAQEYAREGIYMNSVDTGWITEENPHAKKMGLQNERGFYTPLDVIDGASRIYDPIVQGICSSEEPLYGYFLKDYAPCAW